MSDAKLFPDQDDFTPKPKPERAPGIPRISRAERDQVFIIQSNLEALIEEGHQVRFVWAFVNQANLDMRYNQILSVEGHAGRAAIDPKILLALWIFATLCGVGSARALEKLCDDHIAYRWICGGVSVNYHTLADFRSGSKDLFESVLTDSVAALLATGMVTMDSVAHDGLRVRANAGRSSFRREETLKTILEEAKAQVEALSRETTDDPAATDRRKKSAGARAAKERQERIEKAIDELKDVKEKKKDKTRKARASTTDPEARSMHMPDGGTRPGYNVQFGATTGTQIVVSAAVTNSGSDSGQLVDAVDRIAEQYEEAPKKMLVDGGFFKGPAIEEVEAKYDTTVYMPQRQNPPKGGARTKGKKVDRNPAPAAPQKEENETVLKMRKRMETPEAKEIYKERASTIECVNALARNRGLKQFPVRGLEKVTAVTLLFAITHNVMRMQSLSKTA